jgi:hypothetical protein
VEPVETLVLESGERLQGEIKYYDYGVLSLVFELAFMDGWSKLTRLASRWVWSEEGQERGGTGARRDRRRCIIPAPSQSS